MKTTNLKHRPPLWAAMCSVTGLVLGCDHLADSHAAAPALASYRGTLELAVGTAAPEGDVKVALAWTIIDPVVPNTAALDPANPCYIDPSELSPDAPMPSEGGFDPSELGYLQIPRPLVAQQVDVRPGFPAKFTLTVTDPPARKVLHPPLEYFKPNSQLGEGQLIVYLDRNENGALDPSTFASPSPDLLLSASASPLTPASRDMPPLEVVYMDRAPVLVEHAADIFGESTLEYYAHEYDQLEPGYNLVNADPSLARPERLPDDAVISLELNPTPYAQLALCSEYCQRPERFECPEDPRELPAADSSSLGLSANEFGSNWYTVDERRTYMSSTFCAEVSGGRYFSYSRVECEGCVCTSRECSYWVDKLPSDTTVPCESYASGGGKPADRTFVN